MAQVTFDPAVGGSGLVISDDANPTTGLDGGGHRTRFVPALAQVVAIAAWILGKANAAATSATNAAASAASALGAPGTNATSTTNMTIGTGNKTFTIEAGKLYNLGQTVVVASGASPINQMAGIITAYNINTGSMTVNVSFVNGSGTFADWDISLASIAGVASVPVGRTISTSGLATGGGDLSANRTITVPKALVTDVRAGTDDTKATTSKMLYDAAAGVALADAATITPNNLDGINFHVTLAGNRTLANMANSVPGASGRIRIAQDATGSRTLAFGSAWKFPNGAPTLSTAANAVDILAFFVHDASNIEATLIKDVR